MKAQVLKALSLGDGASKLIQQTKNLYSKIR